MGIIWTIIIGFVAGVIAKFIMPGKNEPSGFVLTTILGIVGAIVGGFIAGSVLGIADVTGLNISSIIVAVFGAVVVLVVWHLINGRRTTGSAV